jgi:hypothetical protein
MMRDVDDNQDFFTEYYRSSVGAKVIIYVAIFFTCVILLAGTADFEQIPRNLQGSADWLVIAPCYMLLNTFMYDRKSFYWSITVGLAWGILGNNMAIPFWMATAALLLSLLTQFRVILLGKVLIWGVVLLCYIDIDPDALINYPFYVISLVIVVIARYMIFRFDDAITPIHNELTSVNTSEVSYKKYLENQELNQQKREDENIVSSFRPPSDQPDQPKPVPKPQPEIVSSYRPPRDQVEDEAPHTIIVAKAAPVKRVFRPAKDDYAGILLMLEKKTLPAAMQTELQGIIKNARMILTSMEEDPEDVKPGNAFLSRYMPALESVVEQIEKLTALETLSSSSSQAMDKCLHALQGLRSAFAQQYEQLQENNQLKFNVEMEMLDSLLKTDGFK